MSIEIEAKFRLTDPRPVRERLRGLGATRVDWRHESNHLFDTKDGRLRRSDCGLRVRVVRALAAPPSPANGVARPISQSAAQGRDVGAETVPPETGFLTFKGPRGTGELKVREELESFVGDAPAVMDVLNRLGWREVVVYEKRREVWRLGRCAVSVDELPRLGWWLEIEGVDADAVQGARRALGLGAAVSAPETYVELAAAYGDEAEDGCRRLTFDTPRT